MNALTITNTATKRSLAEKTALCAEAKRRFNAAMAALKAQHHGSLTKRCDLLTARIDLIQAYGKAINAICNN
jgi:hypothetical protein